MIRSPIRPPGFDRTVPNNPSANNFASNLRSKLRNNQQFVLPLQPRFLRELVIVPLEDILVVDGGDQLQILQGKATQSLLPNLIDLMDGSRTGNQLET
ncbi:MAG: hypothetical protein ACRD63_06265, partial [Pyrinomonadaceae bacterium]